MNGRKRRLTFDPPRELLLTEIARRCRACDAPARVGLTKAEARDYTGFECEACDEWNEDDLSEGDVPEWWEELRVTGLNTLRAPADFQADSGADDPDVVRRMSDAWREGARRVEGPTEVSSNDLPDGSSFGGSSLDGSTDGSLDGSSNGSPSDSPPEGIF